MIGGYEIGSAPLAGEKEVGRVDVPFISSATVLYTIAVQTDTVTLPFISSTTVVRAPVGISSLFYRSESSGSANSGDPVTVSKPSGSIDGDILVAQVHLYINNKTVVPPVVPGGQPWVYRGTSGADDSGNSVEVYTKRGLEEPSSEVWTLTAGGTALGMHVAIVAIGGAHTNDIFEAVTLAFDQTPFTDTESVAGPVTSSDQTALFVAFHSHEFVNTVSLTTAAPYTERTDYAVGIAQLRHVTATHLAGAVTESSTGTWSTAVTQRKSALIAVKSATPRIDTNFIVSKTVVNPPTISPIIYLDFIASTTVVYAPELFESFVAVPFINSVTVVYAPTLAEDTTVEVPFIGSQTVVFPIFSIFDDNIIGTGTGNGGESFRVLLNANGETDTGTVGNNVTTTSGTIVLTGDVSLPSTKAFVFLVGGEQMLIKKVGTNSYRILQRGLGNTTISPHPIGSVGTWGDTYDMAIESVQRVSFEVPVDEETYPGWLIAFDSTQAYSGASRYPFHITNFVGVFPAGGGDNKIDSDQPSAVHTTATISDECPSAMTVPALLIEDIEIGDVAIIRYTNPEGTVLELGSRACAIQAWYAMMRVDDDNNDVTFTDPDGNIVDGTAEEAFFDQTYTTTVLDGDDRVFTYGPPKFSDKGWPIAALAVRHGRRRVPYWESDTWHDFSWVYTGFFDDATYVQILINRNGLIHGPDPEVILPGPQDIDGPDAFWDDDEYYISTAWYVAIFNGPYVFIGPGINIPGDPPPPFLVPIVFPPVGGDPPEVQPPDIFIEGGSGGGIQPPRGSGPIDLSKLRFRALDPPPV